VPRSVQRRRAFVLRPVCWAASMSVRFHMETDSALPTPPLHMFALSLFRGLLRDEHRDAISRRAGYHRRIGTTRYLGRTPSALAVLSHGIARHLRAWPWGNTSLRQSICHQAASTELFGAMEACRQAGAGRSAVPVAKR
jgi:hypothetical protein